MYSATGDGKIPFVSANDIARVGFRALTDEKSHNTDHVILGPDLLSYDQVGYLPYPSTTFEANQALGRGNSYFCSAQEDYSFRADRGRVREAVGVRRHSCRRCKNACWDGHHHQEWR